MTTDAHLIILRASRLEALVPPLMTALAQTCPEDALAPQTVIAAHPGMRQWLTGAMARHAGTTGVVANVEVILPSAWLAQVADERLGEDAQALPAWRREALRWAVLAGLEVEGLSDPRIARYLTQGGAGDAADLARRRFQLADRLAAVFSQYLVYRADWLMAWEAGKSRFATAALPDGDDAVTLECELLAPLWRHLAGRLGMHRARVVERLLAQLHDAGGTSAPLHVFGFSHLPPGEQQVLRAWARQAPVFLYVPDPCREFWGGLDARVGAAGFARLREWQQQEEARIAQADGGEWLDSAQAHPLLARWGRLGQHFYAGLAEWEALADIRDHADDDRIVADDRLARVQESIRRLDIDTMREAEPWPAPGEGESATEHESRIAMWHAPRRADASLRIHACHTRLRELDVLRDALMDAVNAGIAPGDIVVMAPDINAYAPLLPAVFGQPGDARERRLPWHMADAPVMRNHRLFATFARLLDVGSSRVTLPEVADLLAVPEIARALDLDAASHDALLDWLAESRAAWALDATHREAAGASPTAMHTLAWGVDRMLAGYLMADAAQHDAHRAVTLPDGTTLLPLPGVHGPESCVVGALDVFLCQMQRWRDLASLSLRASEWAATLMTQLDTLLRVAHDDAAARAALSTLRSLIARLATEPAQAEEDPLLHFAVVRDLLRDALDAVPERQRFLMGGITFCGMVPQRAIPFDMVCVLGLNDGQFPRQRRDGGIDLMTRLRRLGDRDVRSDDRWLFLETLMSARRRLHLSWLGLGARDGMPRNPASPLAELMAQLDQAAAVGAEVVDARARPWRVQHPLQPFDARYFTDTDTALYSYSQDFAGMRGEGRHVAPAFLAGPAGTPEALPDVLALASLTRFWRRPAEDLLARRLHLQIDAAGGPALPDAEPLDGMLERIDDVARKVFFDTALPQGFTSEGTPRWDASHIPDWIAHGGLLPPGDLGQSAWKTEADAVSALLHAAFAQGLTGGKGENIDADIALPVPASGAAPVRLRGTLRQVFRAHQDAAAPCQLVRAFVKGAGLRNLSELDIGQRLVLFIEWAVLRIATADDAAPVRLVLLADGETELTTMLCGWDAHFIAHPQHRDAMLAALRERLARLVLLWHEAASSPPIYFPKTSQAALIAAALREAGDTTPKGDHIRAAAKIFDGFNGGERAHEPGWTRLVARGIGFDLREHEQAAVHADALLEYAHQLEALMRLSIPEATP